MVQTSFPSHGKIEVGGRNLLRNSDFNATTKWDGIRGTIASAKQDGLQVLKFTSNTDNNNHYIKQNIGKQSSGEIFTASVWVYAEQSVSLSLDITEKYGDVYSEHATPFEKVSGWRKFEVSGTTKNEAEIWFSVRTNVTTESKTFCIYHPKLERGTIATDWTPAPEDILERLATLEAKAGS